MRFHPKGAIAIATLLFAMTALPGLQAPVRAADPPEWEHMERAKEYRDKGELKAAVLELKNALLQNPGNPGARFLLGQVYLDLGQGAAAEKELRRARELGMGPDVVVPPLGEALLLQGEFRRLLEEITVPADAPPERRARIHTLRGEARLALDEADAADQEFQAALRLSPNDTRALLGQGRVLLAGERLDEAGVRIRKALDIDPKYAAAWNALGDLEQLQGNADAAEAAYDKAIENRAYAGAAQVKRALLRIERRDYQGAAEDIREVKKRVKEFPGLEYAAGLLAFRQQRFAEAQEHFQKVLAGSPNHQQSMYFFGASQFGLNNFEQAEAYLSRYLTAVPQSVDAAKLLGIARLNLGDYAGAEEVLTRAVAARPDDAAQLKALGRALQAQGKHQRANEYLQKAVALAPESAPERMELALSHIEAGQRDLALQELQRAAELDPELWAADLLIVRELLQAGAFDAALEAAQALREKRPDSPAPLTLAGLAYLGKGETDKGRAALEQALELEPGNSNAAINLARLAARAGDVERARTYYQQVLEHHPGHEAALLRLADLEAEQDNAEAAQARLEEAVRQNPRALRPKVALARHQLASGAAMKALATLRDIPERYAGQPSVLATLGEARLANGEASSALDPLKQLVRLRPESADAHYLLGSAYLGSGDRPAAQEALLRGLALDPSPERIPASRLMTDVVSAAPTYEEKNRLVARLKEVQPQHAQVLDLEAQLAIKQGDAAKAVTLYRQVHERFPDNPVWLRQLAKSQWGAGDREGHVQTLGDWLQAHPEDAVAQAMLGNAYMQLDRPDRARDALLRTVELLPNHAPALNNLAWLLREQDPRQALGYAQRAHDLRPGDPAVMDTLGVILLYQGQKGRALELLDEATVKWPSNPSILYHYALALKENGRSAEARRVLGRLPEDDFPEKKQARTLLEQLIQ